MAVLPKREQPQHLVHTRLQNFAGQSAKPAHQLQVLAPAQVRIEVRLFGHITHLALETDPVRADIVALEENLSFGRLDQPGKHFDRRTLPGAVGPDVTEDFTRPDGEADTVHGRNPVVSLDQVAHFKHE